MYTLKNLLSSLKQWFHSSPLTAEEFRKDCLKIIFINIAINSAMMMISYYLFKNRYFNVFLVISGLLVVFNVFIFLLLCVIYTKRLKDLRESVNFIQKIVIYSTMLLPFIGIYFWSLLAFCKTKSSPLNFKRFFVLKHLTIALIILLPMSYHYRKNFSPSWHIEESKGQVKSKNAFKKSISVVNSLIPFFYDNSTYGQKYLFRIVAASSTSLLLKSSIDHQKDDCIGGHDPMIRNCFLHNFSKVFKGQILTSTGAILNVAVAAMYQLKIKEFKAKNLKKEDDVGKLINSVESSFSLLRDNVIINRNASPT